MDIGYWGLLSFGEEAGDEEGDDQVAQGVGTGVEGGEIDEVEAGGEGVGEIVITRTVEDGSFCCCFETVGEGLDGGLFGAFVRLDEVDQIRYLILDIGVADSTGEGDAAGLGEGEAKEGQSGVGGGGGGVEAKGAAGDEGEGGDGANPGAAVEMLMERKERLRTTVKALEREQVGLGAQLRAQALTDEQIQTITELAMKVRGGLGVAEHNFEKRRQLIETLDVWATLVVEDGEKVVYAHCIIGKAALSLADSSNGTTYG